MRDITQSMLRFSWAMSLFGVQQMANLLTPSRAAKAFEDVTQAAEGELGQMLKGAFRAGDAALGSMPGIQQRGRGAGPGPGSAPGQAPNAPSFAEPNISPDYPYEPRFAEVFGSRMHYIEAGTGDPILFLHGNPTWSYLWRNVIPHLSSLGRCIAPDLIGFGRSGKPSLEYTWFDHSRYLDQFIETLGLENITLVLHDQGSGLGFHYARRHERNIKAIAFMEAIIRPYPWDEFSTPEFRELFRLFRTGDVGGQGWQMIVEQNMFIEQLLPQAAGRPLTEREMNFYREPFRTRESRIPIWQFPRQTPIGGEPRDVWNVVSEYSEWLQRSALPKLMLYVEPGALITAPHAEWAMRNIRNLQSVFIGQGSHFVQESSPNRIGREVAGWYRSLAGARPANPGASPAPPPSIQEVRAQVLRMLDTLPPGIPLAAIVLFKVDPAKESQFKQEADRLTAATRRLPGCNVFAFHKATPPGASGEPIEYLIYEDWETRELFHTQWTSDHLQHFQSVVGDLVLAAPDLRFYNGWREYRGRAAKR